MPAAVRVTIKQVERVYELTDEGQDVRSIARDVFGSARFKDRVARLLRARRLELEDDDPRKEIARLQLESMRENQRMFEEARELTRDLRYRSDPKVS